MAKRIGKGDAWAGELMDILTEFVDEEIETIDKVFAETAEDTKNMVAETSPKDTGAYASGWVAKRSTHGALDESIKYTVGNPTHYQLTHLLERGHAVRNQFGEPERADAKRRVSARRHIKPAEVWGNEKLLSRLREKL